MKPRSLLSAIAACAAVLLAYAHTSADATIITQSQECVSPSPTPLCGYGATRAEAGAAVTAAWCKAYTGPDTFPPQDGWWCDSAAWSYANAFSGNIYATLCRQTQFIPKGCEYGLAAMTLSATRTIDTCTIATETSGPCGATVAALKAIKKASDDPTRIFHQTLICITSKSCAMRCSLDNCDWLSELVPFFDNRYINQVDDWPTVKAACLARGTGKASDVACAANMAGYHIFNDLVPALYSSGCGTGDDWQRVYTAIEACTAQVGDTIAPGAGSAAAIGTYAARTVARSLCVAGRTAAGKNISVNPNLQGLVCTP